MPACFDAVFLEHPVHVSITGQRGIVSLQMYNNKNMGDKTKDFSWAVRVKSVRVSGNWRVTFVFDGQDAANVNLEDYH